MKIAYYCRSLIWPAGPGVHARALVSAWRAAGHEVLCLPVEPEPGSRAYSGCGVARLRLPRMPHWASAWGSLVKASARLIHLSGSTALALNAFQPDLLVARRFQNDWVLDRLLRRAPCPYVAEVNAVLWRERAELNGVTAAGAEVERENRFLLAAARCVCVTEEIGDQVQSAGVPPIKVLVAPNGVDTQLFTPDVGRPQSTEGLLRGRTPIVVFAGTGALTLDVRTMALAASLILKSLPSVGFLFVGPSHGDLRDWGLARDVLEHSVATGPVAHEEVPAWLSVGDICWAAFLNSYGSPLKFAEYMAMAKPIVAACAGQAEECIIAAGCGSAVERGDSRALALEVCRLAESGAGVRNDLGASGRAWVTQNRDWASVARLMIQGMGSEGMTEVAEDAEPRVLR